MKENLTFPGKRHTRRVVRIYTANTDVLTRRSQVDTEEHYTEYSLPRTIKPTNTPAVFKVAVTLSQRLKENRETNFPLAFQVFDAVDTYLTQQDADGNKVYLEYVRKPLTPKYFTHRLAGRSVSFKGVKIGLVQHAPAQVQELYEWLKKMDGLPSDERESDAEFLKRRVSMNGFYSLRNLRGSAGEDPIFTTDVLQIGFNTFIPLGPNVQYYSPSS